MIKGLFIFLILGFLFLTLAPSAVEGRVSVRGYTRRNGTYVAPYYRTSPNRVRYDNWSSKGNYNLYTGKKGTVSWWR